MLRDRVAFDSETITGQPSTQPYLSGPVCMQSIMSIFGIDRKSQGGDELLYSFVKLNQSRSPHANDPSSVSLFEDFPS